MTLKRLKCSEMYVLLRKQGLLPEMKNAKKKQKHKHCRPLQPTKYEVPRWHEVKPKNLGFFWGLDDGWMQDFTNEIWRWCYRIVHLNGSDTWNVKSSGNPEIFEKTSIHGCQPKIWGTPPKSSLLIGVSIININHPFWGPTPYFWVDTHMEHLLSVATQEAFRSLLAVEKWCVKR